VKTAGDLFRLVPFAVIVIVPFMEFSLPILLKIFPNMLPSTFASQSQKQTNAQKSLAAKIEVVKFLQETMDELTHSVQFDSDADLKAFNEFVERVRTSSSSSLYSLNSTSSSSSLNSSSSFLLVDCSCFLAEYTDTEGRLHREARARTIRIEARRRVLS